MTINLHGIPERVMLDSSVLTRTRGDATGEHADLCRELWYELIKQQHRILIPAIALAEYMEKPPHDRPKRHRNVEVVHFDDEAAAIIATRFPPSVFLRQNAVPGATKAIIKFDTMILASAVRHRAELLFCMDHRLSNLATAAQMPVKNPADLGRPTQLPLVPLPIPIVKR